MDGHHHPPPPPPPPPHGANPRSANSGLPPGNYDIFIVPPHSSGSGFIYLPSLQAHRNSFLAGVACGLLSVAIWNAAAPTLKLWLNSMASGGGTSILIIIGVGIAGWAWGKTQTEHGGRPWSRDASGGANAQPNDTKSTPGDWSTPPPQASQSHTNGFTPSPQPNGYAKPSPASGASAGWEKAREETKKREEERRKQEEIRRKREEAEKQARAAAEKEKWEKMRAREKEVREREARERIARERLAKEKEAGARLNAEKNARSGAGRDRMFGVGEKTDPYAGTSYRSGASLSL